MQTMTPPELESAIDADDCDRVLAAYSTESIVQKKIDPKHDGWLARVRDVPGVEADELSGIHGRLIAHGLLKVQLAGRTEGVRYQLSGTGREQLARGEVEDADIEA